MPWMLVASTIFLVALISFVAYLAFSEATEPSRSSAQEETDERKLKDYKELFDSPSFQSVRNATNSEARASLLGVASHESIRKVLDSVTMEQIENAENMLSDSDYNLDELLRRELEAVG